MDELSKKNNLIILNIDDSKPPPMTKESKVAILFSKEITYKLLPSKSVLGALYLPNPKIFSINFYLFMHLDTSQTLTFLWPNNIQHFT